jgi:hypothetical protein
MFVSFGLLPSLIEVVLKVWKLGDINFRLGGIQTSTAYFNADLQVDGIH